MEGCHTVGITLELSSLFPTLLCLSTEEIVAIWEAVSAYILGQLKLDKGVLLPGLGTFAVVQERFQDEREVLMVRRPVFQMGIDEACLQELMFQTVTIPDDAKIKPLNYRWLSQVTSFPRHMVEDCVRETILLYSFQLRNRQHLSFTFKDIGVLSCRDDVLCMRFYYDCVTGLESKASRIALLRTRLWMPGAAIPGGVSTAQGTPTAPDYAFPKFRFIVISRAVVKALAAQHRKASEQHRMRRATEGLLEKVLQRPRNLSLPVLPSQSPGTRQQDMGKKTSSRVLSPCPGSSPSSKEADRQEPAPPARPTAALPSSEGCRRALQEVRQLSAEWEQPKNRLRERLQQAKAEAAAWEAWSAGQEREPPQALGTEDTRIPHPPAQPRRREVSCRWRKAENLLPAEERAVAAQLERLRLDHLSPQAAQVLRKLEPHQRQRSIYQHVAEERRRRREQQRQLPCTRCWNRSRGGGAGSGGCGSGC